MNYSIKSILNKWHDVSGLKVVVAAFGIFCGVTGIISGLFEIAQSNKTINTFEISIICSDYIMYEDFTYFAVTVIPNSLFTGIIAIIVSSLVIVWSVFFIHKKKWDFSPIISINNTDAGWRRMGY